MALRWPEEDVDPSVVYFNIEVGFGRLLLPSPIDQNRCAHWRNPMDMMRQG
jgi:hypothetical protein